MSGPPRIALSPFPEAIIAQSYHGLPKPSSELWLNSSSPYFVFIYFLNDLLIQVLDEAVVVVEVLGGHR